MKSQRKIFMVAIVILLLFSLSACGNQPAPEPEEALQEEEVSAESESAAEEEPAEVEEIEEPTPEPEPTAVPTETVDEMAANIAEDVGQVITTYEGSSDYTIFIFEEAHDSAMQQIEIAVMLNRLHEQYGLEYIGLEGAFANEPPLDTSWYLSAPSFTPGNIVTEREDVAVQILAEGEISGSELMGMVYDKVIIQGIENKDEWLYEPSDEAWSADFLYLALISAESDHSDATILEFNELYDQEQYWEAFELLINADEWTEEVYARITDDETDSCEELIEIYEDIEDRAAEVGAGIDAETEGYMQELKDFFAMCSARSRTMVEETTALAESHPEAPVAMIIGAAHTDLITELFTEQDISFAVIRNNALNQDSEAGKLSSAAYDRKLGQQSVDNDNQLGALLDGRRKPQPVVEQKWMHQKANIYQAIDMIARAVAAGESPPFDNLPEFEGITIDEQTFEMQSNDDFIIRLTLDDNTQLWWRAQANPEQVEKTLEELLMEAHDRLEDTTGEDPVVDPGEPELTVISSETVGLVSTDEAVIRTTTTG